MSNIPVLLLAFSQDCTCNLQMIVSLEVGQKPEDNWRTYRPKCCGNNNKDEDNSPKKLNDKNQQASSQKFRQLIEEKVKKYQMN